MLWESGCYYRSGFTVTQVAAHERAMHACLSSVLLAQVSAFFCWCFDSKCRCFRKRSTGYTGFSPMLSGGIEEGKATQLYTLARRMAGALSCTLWLGSAWSTCTVGNVLSHLGHRWGSRNPVCIGAAAMRKQQRCKHLKC